jgi:hypothetical protein
MTPRWRNAQLDERLSTGFGFLGVAWLAMLGFCLHANYLLPMVCHFLVAALGAGLAGGYLLLRHGRSGKEELFP